MRLRSALLCATLLLAHAFGLAAARIPVASFAQEDQYSNPKLSPDGKRMAVIVRTPSGDRTVPILMVYTLPEKATVGAIRLPLFEIPLDYVWLNNDRLAIEKGMEVGSREAPKATGEVLAVNADGTRQEYLYGYQMFNSSSRGERYGDDHGFGIVAFVMNDYNGHFLLTEHPWEGNHSMLYDINSATATRSLVADVPLNDLHFDMQADGTPRFAYGDDDDADEVVFRRNDSTRAWDKVDDKLLGRQYYPGRFSEDSREFVAHYSPDGGPTKLIRENLATGKRVTLFEDPVDGAPYLLYASRIGLPIGVRTSIGKPQVRYFDENSDGAKLHKMLAAQFPDHALTFTSISRDGNLVLFFVSSDRDPGSYYLFDRRTMKAEELFEAMEAIEPGQMAERRPVSFKARDGLELHGYLTMPAHPAGSKLPLVLLPHGGPHGPFDTWYFDTDAQFLANRGYAVLQVNYRGSGGRGVTFEEAGYRQWGAKVMDDLVDGVRWAVGQGEVDGARMCVYGVSFGGYSALMLAAREPSLFKCAVGYAGIYDLNLLAKPENNRFDTVRANYVKRYVGTDKANLDQFSPVTLASRITAPVMLVHGGRDKIAPIEHAEAMRAALTAAGRAPEWLYAPTERHGFYDTKNQIEFYQRLEAFLDKHIGH